jgi:hypothetical protein
MPTSNAVPLLDELLAREQLASRQRLTHTPPPPLPPSVPMAGQAFLKGLVADLPELVLNIPRMISQQQAELGFIPAPLPPGPLGETPVQDVMRAHGILTPAGEPPTGDDQAARQMQALALFSRGLGGLIGGPAETAIARGGATIARHAGRELAEAGAGRTPLVAQQGAVVPFRRGSVPTAVEDYNRLKAELDQVSREFDAANVGSPAFHDAHARMVQLNAELSAAASARDAALIPTQGPPLGGGSGPLGSIGPFRGQRGAIGPLDEYMGGLKREAGTPAATSSSAKSDVFEMLEAERAARNQAGEVATAAERARRRVADIAERLSNVQNRNEALSIIGETGDIADPQMRQVIGNAFKDAWERFSQVPIEQQRAAERIIGARPAPLASGKLIGMGEEERTIPVELRQADDGRYRWYDRKTGEDTLIHGSTPEEAMDWARHEWGSSFQQGTAAPQSPLLTATVRDEGGTQWQLALKQDKSGYSWYKQTGFGMEPTGLSADTPEEARQVAKSIWPDSIQIQGRTAAPAPVHRPIEAIQADVAALERQHGRMPREEFSRRYTALLDEGSASLQASREAPTRAPGPTRSVGTVNMADLEGQIQDAVDRLKAQNARVIAMPRGSSERAEAEAEFMQRRQEWLDAQGRLGRARAENERTFGTPAQQARVQTLFKGIAKDPESFQFGGPTASSDIHELAAHHSTPKNPLIAIEGNGRVEIINERTGGYITIRDADKPHPYISSTEAESRGQEQAGGKQMYQAAMSWIANKGKTLDPDPGGISGINKYRKVENAISSYLRHGKEGYIDLSNATTARNLKEMLMESKNYVSSKRPDLIDAFSFDGTAFRRADGSVATKAELTQAIKEKDPGFRQGIGETSLKRALMTRWASGAKRREVIEAAKRFKEPILYALGTLAASKALEKVSEKGD